MPLEPEIRRIPYVSLFTPEMRAEYQKIKRRKPYPFKVDIVEHANALTVRVYQEDIMPMDLAMRANVIRYLLEIRDMITSHGVPCELEGATSAGR